MCSTLQFKIIASLKPKFLRLRAIKSIDKCYIICCQKHFPKISVIILYNVKITIEDLQNYSETFICVCFHFQLADKPLGYWSDKQSDPYRLVISNHFTFDGKK